MKPLIFWSILAMLLMIGCPWLAATFAGSAGMAVCLLLFFGVNPIFSAVCGVFAGKDIKRLGPFQLSSRDYFWQGRGYSLRWVKQRFCCIASAIS